MATRFGLVFDANDPPSLGRFWMAALGYTHPPPPTGYASWAEYDASQGIPAKQAGFWLVDPDGVGPNIFFQPVPERKSAKNRLHIDIKVSTGAAGPEEQRRRIEEGVAPLVALGATMVRRHDDPRDYFIVLTDPEGNEFCLV